jgi:hypothetical protein
MWIVEELLRPPALTHRTSDSEVEEVLRCLCKDRLKFTIAA